MKRGSVAVLIVSMTWFWTKTLNENPNVIYVASEANMPIFRSVGAK